MTAAGKTRNVPRVLPVQGVDVPVEVELTQRVGLAPPTRAVVCGHTRQAIKRGEVFVVSHTDGQVHPACACGQGLYYRDTRFLSGLTWTLGGESPVVLGSSAEHNHFSRTDAMNGAWTLPDGREVRRETIHLAATRTVEARQSGGGTVHESLEIANFNAFAVETSLVLEVRADFKDLFEVRGHFARPVTGTFLRPRTTDDGVELRYVGADNVLRRLGLVCLRTPSRIEPMTWPESHEIGVRLVWDIRLGANGGSWELDLTMDPRVDEPAGSVTPVPLLPDYTPRDLPLMATRITASHAGLETFINRGIADIQMLCTPTPYGPYPTAGIPWYACPFGRDGLITAWQTLPMGPAIAEATLAFLAAHQGQHHDPFRDEEPGKIPHELRGGELANMGEVPHTPYYGTVDATPLWLILLSETYRWTGRLEFVKQMWPYAVKALEWLEANGDRQGDGFLVYKRKGEKGLGNQGWKDSYNAIMHPDGSLATAPIALAEVQGYVYDAKKRMGELARAVGDRELAFVLERDAKRLKRRFNDQFWNEAGRYYVLAIDGEGKQVLAKTTNPGHALTAGLIDESRVAQVAASMLAPDMFNGWGLRTMSADMPQYNPLSYHNGTVWPHDTALVARGLAERGHPAGALVLLEALYATATHFPGQRLPELFCGFPRAGEFARPVPYPVACSPQAWAAGAPLMLLQAVLGLRPDAPAGKLRVVRPMLPAWVDSVTLMGMGVGDATVDLAFERHGDVTSCRVIGRQGDLRIEVEA